MTSKEEFIDPIKDFRHGIFYKKIYKYYDMTEEELIFMLQRKIKGRYDYKRILSGGIEAQNQFIKHLNNRWNPLEPDTPWKSISPYIKPEKREGQLQKKC